MCFKVIHSFVSRALMVLVDLPGSAAHFCLWNLDCNVFVQKVVQQCPQCQQSLYSSLVLGKYFGTRSVSYFNQAKMSEIARGKCQFLRLRFYVYAKYQWLERIILTQYMTYKLLDVDVLTLNSGWHRIRRRNYRPTMIFNEPSCQSTNKLTMIPEGLITLWYLRSNHLS